MNKKDFFNQKKYNLSLCVFSQLRDNKLITETEFKKAEQILNGKYKPLIPHVIPYYNLN